MKPCAGWGPGGLRCCAGLVAEGGRLSSEERRRAAPAALVLDEGAGGGKEDGFCVGWVGAPVALLPTPELAGGGTGTLAYGCWLEGRTRALLLEPRR